MSGKFMRIKKLVIPAITAVVMMSQIVGCSMSQYSELETMINNNESIEITVAEPVYSEQGTEKNFEWAELDQKTSHADFRKDFDYYANVQNQNGGHKNGSMYVDLESNWTGNSTLYFAFMNQYFIENVYNVKEVMQPIQESIKQTYSDLSSGEEKMAALNAYFELVDDADPNYFNGGKVLTRAEFMEAFARSFTQVDNLTASDAFQRAVDPNSENPDLGLVETVADEMYLTTGNGSLDSTTFGGAITKGEAVYTIVQHFFADEYNATTGKEKAFEDTKNGGNIAEKQGFAGKQREEAYELAYAIQNPEKAPEDIYRALVVAKNVGIIDSEESEWDNGLTKTEFLEFITSAFEAVAARDGYATNAKFGNTNTEVAESTEEVETEISTELTDEEKEEILAASEKAAQIEEEALEVASESVIAIVPVDKTLYTNTTANVRLLPSKDGDIRDTFPINTLVHVIGETEDGEWSKIEDDRSSESLYIKSSLLSEQPTEVKTADNEKASTDNGAVAPKTEAPSTPVVPENPVQTPDVDGETPEVGQILDGGVDANGNHHTFVYMGSSADRMSQGLGF